MTTTMGGAMDLNRVEKSLEEFDALLDASSLGAPRVRAVRSHTPEAMREELAARLADRSVPEPDAADAMHAERAAQQDAARDAQERLSAVMKSLPEILRAQRVALEADLRAVRAALGARTTDAVPRPVTPWSAPMGIDHGITFLESFVRGPEAWSARGPHSGIRSQNDGPHRLVVSHSLIRAFLERESIQRDYKGHGVTPFSVAEASGEFGLTGHPEFALRDALHQSHRMAVKSLRAELVHPDRTDCEPFSTRLRRELTVMQRAREFAGILFAFSADPSRTWQAATDRIRDISMGRFGMGVKLALACSGSLPGEQPFGTSMPAHSFLGRLPAATSLYSRSRGHHWSDPVGALDGWPQRREPHVGHLDGEQAAYTWIAWGRQARRAQHWWYRVPGRLTTACGHPRDSIERVSRLDAGTHYVFCKMSGDNQWWLQTDLDTEAVWHQYVFASYLFHWGNNRAKEHRGHVIPESWSGGGKTASVDFAAHEALRTTAAQRDGGRDHWVAHSIYEIASMEQHGCLPTRTWRTDLPDTPDQRSAMAHVLACAGPSLDGGRLQDWLERLSRLLAGTHAWSANPWDMSGWDLLVAAAGPMPVAWPVPVRTLDGQAASSAPAMQELEPFAGTESAASRSWMLATASCHMETAQGVTTVRATSCLHLLAQGEPIPVPTSFTYRSDDPYAVHAVFKQLAEHEVPWTFARDLLVEGMDGFAGSGDVQVWKADKPADSQSEQRVHIALIAPEGTAVLQMRQADLRQFLERTQTLVGYGTEHAHMQRALDTVTKELLHRSTPAGTQGAPRTLTGDPGESFTIDERPETVRSPGAPVAREREHQAGRCAALEKAADRAVHESRSGRDPL